MHILQANTSFQHLQSENSWVSLPASLLEVYQQDLLTSVSNHEDLNQHFV